MFFKFGFYLNITVKNSTDDLEVRVTLLEDDVADLED